MSKLADEVSHHRKALYRQRMIAIFWEEALSMHKINKILVLIVYKEFPCSFEEKANYSPSPHTKK